MDALTPPALTSATPVNRKLKWYYAHKDEPDCKARLKQSRADYYQRNKDRLKAQMLEKYYIQKALKQQQGTPQ